MPWAPAQSSAVSAVFSISFLPDVEFFLIVARVSFCSFQDFVKKHDLLFSKMIFLFRKILKENSTSGYRKITAQQEEHQPGHLRSGESGSEAGAGAMIDMWKIKVLFLVCQYFLLSDSFRLEQTTL